MARDSDGPSIASAFAYWVVYPDSELQIRACRTEIRHTAQKAHKTIPLIFPSSARGIRLTLWLNSSIMING
jgi:hypothetical protein